MAQLMQVVKDEKWELKIENGKIVVEEETMELLLKLLNNDRLRSPINGEMFDSSVKKAVAKESCRRMSARRRQALTWRGKASCWRHSSAMRVRHLRGQIFARMRTSRVGVTQGFDVVCAGRNRRRDDGLT